MEKTRATAVRSVSQGVPPRTSASATSTSQGAKVPKTLTKTVTTATSPNRYGSLGTTMKATPQPAPDKKDILKKAIGEFQDTYQPKTKVKLITPFNLLKKKGTEAVGIGKDIIKNAVGAIKNGASSSVDKLLAPKPMSKQQKKYIEEFEINPQIQKQLDEKRKNESLNKFY